MREPLEYANLTPERIERLLQPPGSSGPGPSVPPSLPFSAGFAA